MKSRAKRQGGSSVVEFALVAPLLFLLLFGIVEMGLLFWVNLTMQYAVREGVRYAITGRKDLDPNAANQQRYLAVVQRIKDSSMGIYSQVNPAYSITINPVTGGTSGAPITDSSKYTSTMFGKPGDIVVLRLDCTWPLLTPLIQPFFPSGQYKFSVAATMRNEAYE